MQPARQPANSTLPVVTIIGVLIAVAAFCWWLSYSRSRVTAYLQIPRDRGLIIDDDDVVEPWEEYRRRRDDYKSLLTTPLVIESALSQPDVSSLDLTRQHSASPTWPADDIEIDCPNDGEVMRVSLTCNREEATQAVKVLDAVLRAFQEKILLVERIEMASAQGDFRTIVSDIRQRLETKLAELQKMENASPAGDDRAIAFLKERCAVERKLLTELEIRDLKYEVEATLRDLAERDGRTMPNTVGIIPAVVEQ